MNQTIFTLLNQNQSTMRSLSLRFLLLLFTLLSANLCLISIANSSPSPSDIQEKQLRNILDALLGGGDFANWANFLSSTKPLTLPLSATLFIPSNAALAALNPVTASGLSVDPFLVAYHIVPEHLTFSHLQKLPLHSRIPTLLTSNSIIVTNNSRLNFTIDDSVITHPDMFNSSGFSVHGVSKILDYKVHGVGNVTIDQQEDDVAAAAPAPSQPQMRAPAPRRPRAPQTPNNSRHEGGDSVDNATDLKPSYSGASSCLGSDFFMVFVVFGIAWSFRLD